MVQDLCGVNIRQKPKPWDAFESKSGDCPKGGPHNWKFGKCRLCGKNEGYGKYGVNGGVTNREMKRTCPTCTFSWMDHYRKNECPKCLEKLDTTPRRQPGEVSTFKRAPSDALESHSGVCSKGGAHAWKFGRCSQCGTGQGFAANSFKSYNDYM